MIKKPNNAGLATSEQGALAETAAQPVATRSVMKSVDTTKLVLVSLREDGREGLFEWKAGNYTTEIAADPFEGIYVKADAIAASAGAWVRSGDWDTEGGDPRWFGAAFDGIRDDAVEINAALTLLQIVKLAPTEIKCGAPIVLSRTGHSLIGSGSQLTTILSDTTDQDVVRLANGIERYLVEGMTLRKTITAVSGGWGLRCVGSTDRSRVIDVHADRCFIGFRFSTCDTGEIRGCHATNCVAYGFLHTNEANYEASQWGFHDILAARNGSDGVRVESQAGPAGLIPGTWSDVKTFANSGFGISVLGNSTTPVYDLRLENAFIGSDALGAMYFDSYGTDHRVSGFFERVGLDATGPDLGTPAGNVGSGITITSHNDRISVATSSILGCAENGIRHEGGMLMVGSCTIANNGVGSVSGNRNGILTEGATSVLICGSSFLGNTAGASQLYGVASDGLGSVGGAGNRLSGNATAPSVGFTPSSFFSG